MLLHQFIHDVDAPSAALPVPLATEAVSPPPPPPPLLFFRPPLPLPALPQRDAFLSLAMHSFHTGIWLALRSSRSAGVLCIDDYGRGL